MSCGDVGSFAAKSSENTRLREQSSSVGHRATRKIFIKTTPHHRLADLVGDPFLATLVAVVQRSRELSAVSSQQSAVSSQQSPVTRLQVHHNRPINTHDTKQRALKLPHINTRHTKQRALKLPKMTG